MKIFDYGELPRDQRHRVKHSKHAKTQRKRRREAVQEKRRETPDQAPGHTPPRKDEQDPE